MIIKNVNLTQEWKNRWYNKIEIPEKGMNTYSWYTKMLTVVKEKNHSFKTITINLKISLSFPIP